MIKIAFAFVGILLPFLNFSQSCLPDGITFQTQAQIDNFHVNYPGCKEIEGTVTIKGPDITNLLGLKGLTRVGRDLEIEVTGLNDLKGLDSLVMVGSHQEGNYILIDDNENLTSLEGLESLTSTPASLEIFENPSLSSLSGIENLIYIGGLFIQGGLELHNLSGLENLSQIEFDFQLYGTSLTNLEGLNNLNSIGRDLEIRNNQSLTSLTGLESLSSIGMYLSIKSNSKLVTLQGLENLKTLRFLTLHYNVVLNDISSLENVDFITETIPGGIDITTNDSLSDCAIKSICIRLNNPWNISIIDNAPGCNTKDEVDEACGDLTVEEPAYSGNLSLYPNPTKGKFMIESHISACKCQFILYNIDGKELLQCQPASPTTTIDITDFPNGIYILKLITNQSVTVNKIIKN